MTIRSQSAPHGYCAADGWAVSHTTGSGIAGARVSVHRWRKDQRWRPGAGGDLDGRLYPSADAARAAQVQAGYVTPYRPAHAAWKAAHRWMCRDWARIYVAQVRGAGSHADLVTAADAARTYAIRAGVPVVDATRYALAVWSIARKMRGDLMAVAA